MRYADSRVYLVPESLAELNGPTSGLIRLPKHLDWSEQHLYDLDDRKQIGLMYERVIREASCMQDLTAYLDAQTLARLWNRLYLPPRVRRLWEGRFPALAQQAA